MKKIFNVKMNKKSAKISVNIIEKKYVFYDDSNLTKKFKKQAFFAERILDAMIAKYIDFECLVDI